MTGPEADKIAALTREVRSYHADLIDFKRLSKKEAEQMRDYVKPAVEFYENIRDAGGFIKWGVGIGAGAATIYIALHAAGLV